MNIGHVASNDNDRWMWMQNALRSIQSIKFIFSISPERNCPVCVCAGICDVRCDVKLSFELFSVHLARRLAKQLSTIVYKNKSYEIYL